MSDSLTDLFREHGAVEGDGGAPECLCDGWREWLGAHYIPGTAGERDYYAEHLAAVVQAWLIAYTTPDGIDHNRTCQHE